MANRLEDLDVYNLSADFAEKIWTIVLIWDPFSKSTIGKQLVRSADSISANIAEGFGRYHYKENKNFCYFSRGSILETKSWIKKSANRNLITTIEFENLIEQLELIHIKLNAYIKHIGKLAITKTDD
ncbi:four helix bundle protein [Mucilaginibacter conchicola]|uniref:Four helix bundle protein n=1 Tax=Mucilaginibacter conchicola TaxID=2303333 RepID=A0A372NYS5_9SPHI|nr:four helix bundle protein [Mucilaginibacter conchicola]RFZ95044.1 four helix bundle protein [Mucilaginibacter conchicola]